MTCVWDGSGTLGDGLWTLAFSVFSGISGSRVRFLQAMLFCHVELGGVIRHAQVNFQGCSRCSLKKKTFEPWFGNDA